MKQEVKEKLDNARTEGKKNRRWPPSTITRHRDIISSMMGDSYDPIDRAVYDDDGEGIDMSQKENQGDVEICGECKQRQDRKARDKGKFREKGYCRMASELEKLAEELSELKHRLDSNPQLVTTVGKDILANYVLHEQNSSISKNEQHIVNLILGDVKKKRGELRMMQDKLSLQLEELKAHGRELKEKKKLLGVKQGKLDTVIKLLKSQMSNEKNGEMQFAIDYGLFTMADSLDINWEDVLLRSEIVDHLHEWSSKLGYVNFAEYLFVLDPELKRRIASRQEKNKIPVKTSSSENIEKNENELGIEERKEKSGNTPSVSEQSACESASYVNENIPEDNGRIDDNISESNAASSKEDIPVVSVSVDEVSAEPPEVEKSGAECPVGTGHMSSAQEKLLEAEESKLKNTSGTIEEKKLKKEYKETKCEKNSVETNRHIELEDILKYRKKAVTGKCSEFRPSKFFKKSVKQSDEATLDLVKALKLEEESVALRSDVAGRAIFWSAHEGNSALAHFLLKELPEIRDAHSGSGTPIHVAAQKNQAKTLKVLVEGGMNVNEKILESCDALSFAVFQGHFSVVEILLKAGADVNAQNTALKTSLHVAADGKKLRPHRLKCLQLLLEAGADKEIKDLVGFTPLSTAVFSDFFEAVDLLLSAGADVNVQNNFENSPLHLAISDGRIDIFRRLLEAKPNLELRTNLGLTALHLAVFFGRTECVVELLKAGADKKATDRKGRTPSQLTNRISIKSLLRAKW